MENREIKKLDSSPAPAPGHNRRDVIFQSSPYAIVLLDRQGRILDANPAALAKTNLSLPEVLRLAWINWMSEETRELFFTSLNRALKEKISLAALEIDITLPGEPTQYFEIDLTPAEDQGIPETVFVVAREQTMRKQRERDLRESHTLYRALVEDGEDIVFQLDAHGSITYISPNVARICLIPAELLGTNLLDIFPPDKAGPAASALKQALDGSIVSFDYLFTYESGRNCLFHVSLQPVFELGRQVGVFGKLSELEPAGELDHMLEKRAAHLLALNQIGREITSDLELDNVLQNAVDLLHASFGYYHVAVYTQDEKSGDAVMRASAGSFSPHFPLGHRLPAGHGMVGWVFENQRTLLTNDVNNEVSFVNLYPERILSRSELAVPILLRDKIAGALDVQSPIANAFAQDDVRVIETVASQLAVAIANALLYAQAQERLREKQAAEELLRLQRDMLAAVGQAFDFQIALNQILEILNPMQIFDSGSIYLVDAAGGMRAVAHSGLTPEFAAVVDYLPAEANKTRFIKLGNPGYMRYADLDLDPRIPSFVRQKEALLSLAMLPIINQGEVIACLTLGSHLSTDIPSPLRVILEAASQQLGAVIFRLKIERDLTIKLAGDQVLLEAIPGLLLVSDRMGRILSARSNAGEIIDRTTTLTGRRVAEIFPPAVASRVLAMHQLTLETREVHEFECQFPSTPERLEFFQVHMSPLDQDRVVTHVRGITHRRRAGQDLENRACELTEGDQPSAEWDRQSDRSPANVSREFSAALNSIQSLSAFLEDYPADRLDAEQKEYLDDIRSVGQHILTLIDSIIKSSTKF